MITLTSKIKLTSSYYGKSQKDFFLDLKEHDIIELQYIFRKNYIGSKRMNYAPCITLVNLRNAACFTDSVNRILNRLTKVGYTEL